jgi:hypothetical protein
MRVAFAAIVLAFIFGLACVPSEPSPNADPVLTSPPSKAVTIYPQLDVRVYPEGSADVLLNPVPLDGGLFPSGMIVTIDVLSGPGWEIDEDGWKGPVFDIAGDTAKIEMISTQNIVIKMRPAVRPQAGRPAPKPQASGATSINEETVTVITEDDGLLDWHLERYGETFKILEVSETGSQDKIKLKLWSRPSSDAVLSIVSDDTGEVAVSPGTLTFTNSNWDSMQTVTLTGVDDTDRDGNQTTIVKVSGVGDGWTSLQGEALYVVTEDDDVTLEPPASSVLRRHLRLLGQGTGNAPAGTPPPTVSTCLSIESYSGAINDSGTFVQTIGQLPIRRGETISVSGTYYYDGTWKVLQYFRYNDLWGYRIEEKWQGFPDDKDPMVCTLP